MCLPRATYLQWDGGDGGAHGEERRSEGWRRKTLKAFGLDHRSVGDWYRLATHLARVLFARRRPGPSKKWTAERLCLLLADVAAYKRKHPKLLTRLSVAG